MSFTWIFLVLEIHLTPQIMYQQLTNIVASFAGCFKYISTNFYRHKKMNKCKLTDTQITLSQYNKTRRNKLSKQ